MVAIETKLNFDFKTSQAIIRKVGFVDSFKGKWKERAVSESFYLKELKQIATIESIGSSARIEGATMTNEEVEEFIQSIKITSFKSRDEQEVYGYYQVLNLVLEGYLDVDFTENNIHHLHKLLLKESSRDSHHRGNYKKLSNRVVANYPGGHQKVIFATTSPHLVATEMSALVSWGSANLQNRELHPLIVIATIVYEFLSIHPYQDGNGRMSRLLTTLLLLREGYDFMGFSSMEYEIERRKAEYYRVLMDTQKHRGTADELLGNWLLFFLDCLEKCILKLEDQYAKIKNKKAYLNQRQKEVIAFIRKNQPIKMKDLINHLTIYTPYTLRKDISYLVKEKYVAKAGRGKATIYTMKQ